MAASPWPIPGVSTITRSHPAALHAATMSSSALGHLGWRPRVASERKYTCGGSIAFMRMRSPSSAPPPAPAGGVDGEHRDAELVLLVEAEAADQLVGERRLARAAGAGDAEHGTARAAAAARAARRAAASSSAPASRAVIARASARAGRRRAASSSDGERHGDRVDVALRDDRVDHRRRARGAGRPRARRSG